MNKNADFVTGALHACECIVRGLGVKEVLKALSIKTKEDLLQTDAGVSCVMALTPLLQEGK